MAMLDLKVSHIGPAGQPSAVAMLDLPISLVGFADQSSWSCRPRVAHLQLRHGGLEGPAGGEPTLEGAP